MTPVANQPRLDVYKAQGKITCIGLTFDSEDDRRAHFRELLREKLKDPAFRSTPGFPQATDEAILAMSDPPYFTACPNPFLAAFVEHHSKPYDAKEPYVRPPLAVDISVGKTDPLYRAHGYHTKVPHQAIVPSILHYTKPGDLILDGFGGSGMTAVAAQFCGTAPASFRATLEHDWAQKGLGRPEWGVRHAILNDLSPAACFIAANYITPFDVDHFERAAQELLAAARQEIGWMYQTTFEDSDKPAEISYTVWSEVFACASCNHEIVFTEAEKEEEDGARAKLKCDDCGALGKKEDLTLVTEKYVDLATGEITWRPRRVPTFMICKSGRNTFKKELKKHDRDLIKRIGELQLPAELPTLTFPDAKNTNEGRMRTTNVRAVHHLFLPRASHAAACLWRLASQYPDERIRKMLLFTVEQTIWGMSVLARYVPTHFSQVNQYLSGVFYVGSQIAECSPWYILDGKVSRLVSAFRKSKQNLSSGLVTVGSAAAIAIPDSSIDYIFTDPPFGGNILYADLNFVVESWHKVRTAVSEEAVIDGYRDKDLFSYQTMMAKCFTEYYRVLKPGRWMTVVFSNSQASVWNAIQVALQQAGFVVAEVTALDKKQGSFKQITSTNAVKQDLVISAYKPNGGLEHRFEQRGPTVDSAWDFVQTHLKNLSVVKSKGQGLEQVAERDPRRIYDRMVAWFVRHGEPVPLSIAEFNEGIVQRFPTRDGMVFLPVQVNEYDRQRLATGAAPQRELFVDDERSAIDWLTDYLKEKPSTYQEIVGPFLKKLGAGWRKHEAKPDLQMLLDDNFLKYDGSEPVPNQIHRYLSTNWRELRNLEKSDPALVSRARDRWYVPDPNKQQDVEKRREKALLREFEIYRAHRGRRLKEFRLEAVRAGFKAAWANKDYRTIMEIADKISEEALQEDEMLLNLHSMASIRYQRV